MFFPRWVHCALVELPAYAMTMFLLTTCNVGRRYCHGHLMILTGICCLLSTFLSHLSSCDKELPIYKERPFSHPLILASFIISSIGKFSVASTFAIIYNYTSELFPTPIRTNAVAIGSAISRIGGAMSPFILGLYTFRNWLPGTLSVGNICLLNKFFSTKIIKIKLSKPENILGRCQVVAHALKLRVWGYVCALSLQ